MIGEYEVKRELEIIRLYDKDINMNNFSHLHTNSEKFAEMQLMKKALVATYTNMHIIVRQLAGPSFLLRVEERNCIGIVKIKIQNIIGTPSDQQQLIIKGQILLDEKRLIDYNIQSGTIIHLNLKLRGD